MPTADSTARIRGAAAPKPTANVSSRDTISVAPGAGAKYNMPSATVSPYTSAPIQNSGGGSSGGSYGGSTGGVYGGTSFAAAAPPPPSEEDYLAGDSGYQAQLAALIKALELYKSDDTAERTRYETDYSEGLRNLGWTRDDPATEGVDESAWNWEDQNTASGRAYQNQLNDFASRGMLQSSGYGRAVNDLQRSFNDQLGSTNRARTDFLSQRDRDLAAYQNENTSASQQARAEALARRAAQYML